MAENTFPRIRSLFLRALYISDQAVPEQLWISRKSGGTGNKLSFTTCSPWGARKCPTCSTVRMTSNVDDRARGTRSMRSTLGQQRRRVEVKRASWLTSETPTGRQLKATTQRLPRSAPWSARPRCSAPSRALFPSGAPPEALSPPAHRSESG